MIFKNPYKEYFESYTNVAYNIMGFVILFQFALVAGVIHFEHLLNSLFFQTLGIASFVFHINKTKPIYLFDWWAMAFMNMGLAGYHFGSPTAWVLLITFHVLYSYFLMGKLGVYVEVAITSVVALAAIIYNTGWLNGVCIAVLFLIAIWIRSKDKDPKQAIFHDSVYHGLWHILTAPKYYAAFYINIGSWVLYLIDKIKV